MSSPVPRGKLDIPTLQKPHVQAIRRAETQLKGFQDEKLDIYKKHIDHAAVVFGQAREVRSHMQDEYDQRNRFILDKLAEIRARTDAETRRLLEQLRSFSNEFDDGVAKRKNKWRNDLAHDQTEVSQRSAANDAELEAINTAIITERDACLAQTESETGPIIEKLDLQSKDLERQLAERKNDDVEFRKAVEEHFSNLKKTLRDGADARNKQCIKARASADKLAEDLIKKLSNHAVIVRKELQDLDVNVKKETVERAASQDLIVHNMTDYMAQFEGNIAETQSRQDATRRFLMAMKASMTLDS